MSDLSRRHAPERLQRQVLEKLYACTRLTPFEQFRHFPVFTPRYNLARFLAHYEIFKKIVELPGAIVDVGVYRGGSTFTWAKLCEIFCPTDAKKVVYGFDTFCGFPNLSPQDDPEDGEQDRCPGGYDGGPGIEADLALAQEAMNQDKHLRHLNRIELIKGDIKETAPAFVAAKGHGLRIALLNLDVDLYEPTRVALKYFAPLMVSGGIIIVDEYAVPGFGGESLAVDEYFVETTGRKPFIKKFTWHSNPSGFIVIEP
jgi:hypothetical protein